MTPLRVAVAGAAGRMGQTVCGAVERAEDLTLTGRADPALGTALADVLGDADVLVDFTVPETAAHNAREAVAAGVHVVIGTTGFDIGELEGLSGANVFVAPNFAIGAVLMMQFAAQASRHMARAEIIELHHDGKLDAPSGTAARTAALMGGEVPIHSVRLPGLVAHQEVILGDVGQTLTIRHDSIDRESFMPGVLLAVRRVPSLERSPVVGLEHLLDPESPSKAGLYRRRSAAGTAPCTTDTYRSTTFSRVSSGCSSHQLASDSPAPTIAWAIPSISVSDRPLATGRLDSSIRRTAPAICRRRSATSAATGRFELASPNSTFHPSRCSSTKARNSPIRCLRPRSGGASRRAAS